MSDHDSSRREFFERAGLWVAGATLARRFDLRPNESPKAKPLGVALVGLGSLSTFQLAPALQKTTRCRLAGIVTGTPAKAARWKAQYNIPDTSIYNYTTMDRLVDNPDVDIVYIVTPNALHGEHAIKALRAKKHVFCEKPMEVSVEKCDAMIAQAKAVGKQLGVAYRCRFEPHHKEMARLSREQTFGPVKLIEAGFGFTIGDPSQWRLNHDLSGGGPLMDVGIYALQSARMYTREEPIAVSAFTTKTDPVKFKSVEESITFQLAFPSGVLADCRATFNAQGVNRAAVHCTRGSFGLEPAYDYTGIRGWRRDGQPLRFDPVDQFATELDDFASCVESGTPTSVPGEEGRRDTRILMAIYEAARTGRTIRLDTP